MRRRVGFAAGAVGMLVGLGLLLAHAAARGRFPLGHPWIELAFVAAAGNFGAHAARPEHVAPDGWPFYVAGGLLVAPVLPVLWNAFAF